MDMSEQANQLPVGPQSPTVNDRNAWHAYWQERCQPWRTEPEIDGNRQTVQLWQAP